MPSGASSFQLSPCPLIKHTATVIGATSSPSERWKIAQAPPGWPSFAGSRAQLRLEIPHPVFSPYSATPQPPRRVVIQRSPATKDLQSPLRPSKPPGIQNHRYFRIGDNPLASLMCRPPFAHHLHHSSPFRMNRCLHPWADGPEQATDRRDATIPSGAIFQAFQSRHSQRIAIRVFGETAIAEDSAVLPRISSSVNLNPVGVGRVLGGNVYDHISLQRAAFDKARGLIVISSSEVHKHANEAISPLVIPVQRSGDPTIAVGARHPAHFYEQKRT